MEFAVLLLVLVFLFVLVMNWKTGSPAKVAAAKSYTALRPDKEAPLPRSPYRATSIVSDDHACVAIKAIGIKRFLDVERSAPRLPLLNCDTSKCNCKYVGHEDRRLFEEDRRHPNALKSQLYDKGGRQNRRQQERGCREGDWA